MKKTQIWLFNFSSSWNGGGLTRVIETVKWFDINFGAYFILNDKIKSQINAYSKKNKYFFVSPNKLKRLFFDGYYISEIIEEIGKPDIYFSYGIPIFNDIGTINWFHISNALSLKTKNISLPFSKRIQMWILRDRIIKSMKFADISTGESEFSINLLKKRLNKKNIKCFNEVLPNGFNKEQFKDIQKYNRKSSCKYAITIGAYSYKRIKTVLKLFFELKKTHLLEKLIIIGSIDQIPKSIINHKYIDIFSNISNEELFSLLYNAEYYYSASQIENSSIAAVEALILSKNLILSNIPSHAEMLRNFKTKKLFLDNSKTEFIVLMEKDKDLNSNFIPFSWTEVNKKLFQIVDNYYDYKISSKTL